MKEKKCSLTILENSKISNCIYIHWYNFNVWILSQCLEWLNETMLLVHFQFIKWIMKLKCKVKNLDTNHDGNISEVRLIPRSTALKLTLNYNKLHQQKG